MNTFVAMYHDNYIKAEILYNLFFQTEVENLNLQEQALDERIRLVVIANSKLQILVFSITHTIWAWYNLESCFSCSDMREKLRGLTEDENSQR